MRNAGNPICPGVFFFLKQIVLGTNPFVSPVDRRAYL